MGEVCRFCDIIHGEINGEENQPIWENSDYFALASIGALVEGWVLIIPKKHVVSMKDLYNAKDFVDFTNNTLNAMRLKYPGPYISFEHGPNKCGSKTSCGTNHAHLHLVPYRNSLYKDMFNAGLTWENCNASQVFTYARSEEYLFYSEISTNSKWEDHTGYIHILEQPVSQYFRKLIACQINRTDEYDYKKYARIDVAIETNRTLAMAAARE